jgi:lipid A oxidase
MKLLKVATSISPSNLNKPRLFALLLVAGFLLTPSVKAEVTLGVFAGKSFVDNGDLNMSQGNTNLNYKDVSWDDKSFQSPIFYGARIGYWFNNAPNWGLSVDFSHLKNYLVDSETVAVNGVQNGSPLNGNLAINSTNLEDFNMSHGLNTLTFNGQYRWFPAGQRDQTLLGRMQLYTGLGAGFSIPHVEATVNGIKTYEYQWGAGPVVNGMLGVNYDIYSFISGFVEYKLTYADVQAELKGGGSINTETVNHQLIFGLAAHFDI